MQACNTIFAGMLSSENENVYDLHGQGGGGTVQCRRPGEIWDNSTNPNHIRTLISAETLKYS